MVAHRASTVLLADRVALLVDGRIAAVGTHSELLASNAAYRNLLSQTVGRTARSMTTPEPDGASRLGREPAGDPSR